jgi:hypothetical protein
MLIAFFGKINFIHSLLFLKAINYTRNELENITWEISLFGLCSLRGFCLSDSSSLLSGIGNLVIDWMEIAARGFFLRESLEKICW